MKRVLTVLVVIFCIVAGAVVIAKDVIAKAALRSGIQALTGCALEIDRIRVGLLDTDVEVKGLRIANPQGFADPVMADIPELYIDYDLGAFLRGMVHLTEVRLDIEKFVVVRNPGNALNVSALKGLIPPPQGSGPPPKIAIDLVVLHIGKAEYRQYGAQMIARDFTLNLDERIKNVTDPKALLNAVISRVLSSAGIAALAGEGLAGLKEQGQQMVQGVSTAVVDQTKTAKQGAEQIVGAVAETVKETADNVKKLLVPSQ